MFPDACTSLCAATKAEKSTPAKKTSSSAADGDKKKRKKVRKETYSSYIYKGSSCSTPLPQRESSLI